MHRLATLLALTSAAHALDITVSQDGATKTLVQARDEIRKVRETGAKDEPAIITVSAGTHEMLQPLTLETQDSFITIRAAKDAKPVFFGAPVVTGWQTHEGKIVKADVSKILPKGFVPKQLLCDGERQILARYPNFDDGDPIYGGWAFVDEFPPSGPPEGHLWKRTLYVKPQDVRKWSHPEDVEIDIFAQYGWWNFIEPVASLDATTRMLTLAKNCSYDLHPHNRFHFQNAIEELDSPGEWFYDKRTGTLYFWPPDASYSSHLAPRDEREASAAKEAQGSSRTFPDIHAQSSSRGARELLCRIPTLDTFIKAGKGARHISIEGLTFTGCHATALSFDGAEDCSVSHCTITKTGAFGGTGISTTNGKNVRISRCEVSFTGGTGISLGGGDRKTLTGPGHIAEDNEIHHVGVFNKNACGIGMNGVALTAAHNHIHDSPRMGVQMSGNNLLVEYNHLHHLCMETQDGGAIYTGGRDWISSRGSVWRYNLIHDIIGVGQEAGGLKHPWFTFGLYPDDNTGGVDIIGNIVYRIAYTPIHLHNSRDCIVENNIFALGGRFQFDLHGWTKEQHYWIDHGPTMVKGYESVANEPAWKNMRGMELHPKNAFRDDGTMMSGDIVRRNIMFSDTAGVKYGDLRNVSPKWNTIDHNLAWSGGHPIITGINKVGPDKGEPLLVENFDQAAAGATPKGWGFNHRPNKDVRLVVADGALSCDCAISDDPKNPKSVFHGPDIPIKPGAAYRVRLRVKSSEPQARMSMAFASFKNGEGYWQAGSTSITATSEWQEVEATGRMLRENETNWKPWMKAFWLRVDCHEPKGQVFIDNIRITEAEPLDEWKAWQSAGWDEHSIVADPMFVDWQHDDWRLKPESPAFKLGFKAIPVEKIGPRK